MTQALLTVTVASDRAAPRQVAATVAEVVAASARRDRSQVEIAVHEAVANAVLHGSPPIEVEVVHLAAAVEVRIVDAGPAPRASTRPRAERGRGQALIAATCDQVWTEAVATGGRRVRLRFTASGAAASRGFSPRYAP